jgi:hypothetical protein
MWFLCLFLEVASADFSLLQLSHRANPQECDDGGASEPVRSGYTKVHDGACASALLASGPAADVDECFETCREESACTHFSYSTSGQCSLHKKCAAAAAGDAQSYALTAEPMEGVGPDLEPPFSITARLRTDAKGAQYVISWGPSRSIKLGPSSQLMYSECCNAGMAEELVASDSLADGDWHDIAVTRESDGQTILYVDGEQVSTGKIAFLPQSVPQEYQSCRSSQKCVGAFNGDVISIRFFDTALSSAQVLGFAGTRGEACDA